MTEKTKAVKGIRLSGLFMFRQTKNTMPIAGSASVFLYLGTMAYPIRAIGRNININVGDKNVMPAPFQTINI